MKLRPSITTLVIVATAATFSTDNSFARGKRTANDSAKNDFRRITYVAAGFDGLMVSTNTQHKEGAHSLPRFTPVLNTGVDVHYDPTTRFGFFAGLAVKNIGIRERLDVNSIGTEPVKVLNKWRMYAIGIPVGFKWGNMGLHGTYCFAGAGVDAGIFYKESAYNSKPVSGRYTGDRPIWLYAFAGGCIKDKLGIKLQYYPTGNNKAEMHMPETGSIAALSISWHLSNHNSYHPQVRKHRMHK